MTAEPRRLPWSPGSIVNLLHTRENRPWCVLPVTVLHDEANLTVVRISAGTNWLAAFDQSGARAHLDTVDWRMGETTWTGDDCTYLIRPGRWCAVGWFAAVDGTRPGKFYINGQRPPVYHSDGIETMDLELDIEIHTPYVQAGWKDRDRLRRARQLGAITAEEEELMTRDMTAAVELVLGGADVNLIDRFSTVQAGPVVTPSAVLRMKVGL